MTNWKRQLDWKTVKNGDTIQVRNQDADEKFTGTVSNGAMHLGAGVNINLDSLEKSRYELYVEDNPEPTDAEVVARNAQLASYTQPKPPSEKIPWTPFQIGVGAFIILVILAVGAIFLVRV